MKDAPWTEDDIARLRSLAADGDSYLVMAAKMGRSKNAVLGKAHRLKLVVRHAPTVRRASVASARSPAATKKPPKATVAPAEDKLAVRPSSTARRVSSAGVPSSAATKKPLKATVALAEDKPAVQAPPTAVPKPAPTYSASHTVPPAAFCCFPIGEPRTPEFRYCDEPVTTPKRTYCDTHHALCRPKSGARAA